LLQTLQVIEHCYKYSYKLLRFIFEFLKYRMLNEKFIFPVWNDNDFNYELLRHKDFQDNFEDGKIYYLRKLTNDIGKLGNLYWENDESLV